MTFGQRLKILRIIQNIKQRQLANNLGVTPAYISLLETNQKRPSWRIMRRLAKFFGMTLSELFEDVD